MNAYTTEPYGDSYFGSAPVLIAGDSEASLRRAALTVEAAGARIGASVPLEQAAERIALQASASAIWIELERDGGPTMDRLLTQVGNDASDGRYPAVVSAGRKLLDPVFSGVGGTPVEVVIDGTEAERAAALALVTSGIHRRDRLSDIAADRSSDRLRQLSDEVSRIASTLARLSTGPDATSRPAPALPTGDVPPVAGEQVRQVIRARRLRSRFFEEDLFADPAWDMLLDLLQAEIAQLRVPVSSLCIAAAVPATTALRWLKTMTEKGIFVRRADPHDGRRVFVELSRDASMAMRRYFAEVRPVVAA
jgi:DNA-binding MarR family transcriptional regulator